MKSMRPLIALLTLLLVPIAVSAQGWEHIYPDSEVQSLKDAVWFNGDTAFVCGHNWTLLKTVDGGRSWENVLHGERDLDIIRIATNGQRIFMRASYPKWHPYSKADTLVPIFAFDPRSETLEDLSFTTLHHGLGVPFGVDWLPEMRATDRYLHIVDQFVYPAMIYRYDLSLRTWTIVETTEQIFTHSVIGDETYCYYARRDRYHPELVRRYTTDAGTTWVTDSIHGMPSDYSTQLFTVRDAGGYRLLASLDAAVYVSDDTGKNWQPTNAIPWQSHYNPYIRYIESVSLEHWYVMGAETGVYETRDAGPTWIQLKESETGYLSNGQRILKANTRGGILIPRKAGWIQQSETGGITWDSWLLPGIVNITRMHFFNANRGVLIGDNEKAESNMYVTTDGGTSWEKTGPLENSRYEGWSSLDAFDEIYSFQIEDDTLVGKRFRQYRTTDQGRSWEFLYESVVRIDVRQFWPMEDIYLMTMQPDVDSSGMYVSEDRGRTWTFHLTEEAFVPKDIQCGRNAEGNAEYFMIPTLPQVPLLYHSADGCKTWEAWYSTSIQGGKSIDELDVTSADTIALEYEQMLHITTTGRQGFNESPIPKLSGDPRGKIDFIYLWPNKLVVKDNLFVASTDDDWVTVKTELSRSSQDMRTANWFFLDKNNGWIACGADIWRTSTGGVNWVQTAPDAPDGFGVSAVYPNPVTAGESVIVSVKDGAYSNTPLRVAVYDLLGREVAVLHEGLMHGDTQTLTWNTGAVRPGMYYITAVSGSNRSVRPIAVVK